MSTNVKVKGYSLKKLIKDYLFSIYPKEASSLVIEEFAREQGYLGETGRKRCGDLVKAGYVKTRVEVIVKQDGKVTEVAFHQAVIEDEIPLTEMPEYQEYNQQGKLI